MNIKQGWTEKRAHDFELQVHFATLKLIGTGDPVAELVRVGADVATAKRFWRGVFQDIPELRARFPAHAERFRPYDGDGT